MSPLQEFFALHKEGPEHHVLMKLYVVRDHAMLDHVAHVCIKYCTTAFMLVVLPTFAIMGWPVDDLWIISVLEIGSAVGYWIIGRPLKAEMWAVRVRAITEIRETHESAYALLGELAHLDRLFLRLATASLAEERQQA